jgi:hypothetical protein
VELSKIRTMCRTLVQELQEGIRELTFGSDVPSIDLGRIVNSMAWSQEFQQQNYSFMEHSANKAQASVGYRYLLAQARRREGRWRLLQKRKGSKQMEWVDGQVKKYLNKEKQFLRKLMVCMHVTGKPALSSPGASQSSPQSSPRAVPRVVPGVVPGVVPRALPEQYPE